MDKERLPYAPRVSSVLVNDLEYHRFNDKDGRAGYRCYEWQTDEHGNPTCRIDWMGTRKDMGTGRFSEIRIQEAHRAKLKEIWDRLVEFGYHITWGWDPETGEPDTTFLVVITKESADRDAQDEGGPEAAENVDVEAEMFRLATMTISLKEASETAMAVNRAYNVGRDEVARRLEQQLMKAVLTAIVYGTDEPVDLAAVALSTQHLPFAR